MKRTISKLAGLAFLALVGWTAGAQADPVGGPKVKQDAVRGDTADVYKVRCWAGEPTLLTLEGDGGTDLDVFVCDENGNLIAKDDDETDLCLVTWTPRWTGKFTIRVINRGPVSNSYTLTIR